MKLPRIWRKKNAAGKFVGNCRITIDGREINLGTSDHNEAEKRRLEAVRRGRRNFIDEIDEAAAAAETGGEGAAAADAVRVSEAQVDTPPPAAAPPPPAAALAAAPLQPDGYIPPPAASTDARSEAEATNDAAAEGDAASAAAAEAAAAAAGPSDEVLDVMLEGVAMLAVNGQIELQAALIRKGLKREPGKIAVDDPSRAAAAKAWVAQLKIWFPSAVQMPPWCWALLIPAGCMVQQVGASTPLPDEKPGDGPQPQAESGDPTVQAAA